MDIQISLGQLLNVSLILGGIGVLLFLFKVLKNLNQILCNINNIVQNNENNINSALDSLPNIVNNAEQITGTVNEEMKHVSGAVRAVEETVEYTASAAQVINEDIIIPTRDLLKMLVLVKKVFVRNNEKK